MEVNRLRSLIISILIALSVVATIAIMPGSRWIFQNQVDLAYRRVFVDSRSSSNDNDLIEAFMPAWLTDPNTYKGNNPSEELTHAMLLHDSARIDALKHYTSQYPVNPLGWAVMVRMVCILGGRPPDSPPGKDPAHERDQLSMFTLGREACLKGEALDQSNAFFPLMQAVFDMELGHLAEMDAALRLAATKPTYDGYLRQMSDAMDKAQVLAKGYRGEVVKTGMAANILLPEFSHIRSLARYLNRKGTLAEKRDLIQATYAMSKGGEVAIAFLVAYADLRLVLRDPIPLDSKTTPKFTDDEYLVLASRFDSKLRAANIVPPMPGTLEIYQRLSRLVKAFQKYVQTLPSIYQQEGPDEWSFRWAMFRMVSPYGALGSLLFSGIVALMAWGFTRIKSDTFRAMAPHLLWIPATVAVRFLLPPDTHEVAETGVLLGATQLTLAFMRLRKHEAVFLSGFVAFAVLYVIEGLVIEGTLAWLTAAFCLAGAVLPWVLDLEKRIRIATIGGALIAALSFFVSDGYAAVAGIIYGISVGILWVPKSGLTPKTTQWLSGILFFLVVAAVSIPITWSMVLNQGAGFGGNLMAVFFLGIFAAIMFVGKPIKTARISACVSLLFFSAAYLVTVGLEIRANRSQSQSSISITNEADNVRKLAGLN